MGLGALWGYPQCSSAPWGSKGLNSDCTPGQAWCCQGAVPPPGVLGLRDCGQVGKVGCCSTDWPGVGDPDLAPSLFLTAFLPDQFLPCDLAGQPPHHLKQPQEIFSELHVNAVPLKWNCQFRMQGLAWSGQIQPGLGAQVGVGTSPPSQQLKQGKLLVTLSGQLTSLALQLFSLFKELPPLNRSTM